MQIKIKKGVIYACEDGMEETPIGSIFDTASEEHERTIECGAEAVEAIKNFVADVNSGKFKPRTVVRKFEELLQKHGAA